MGNCFERNFCSSENNFFSFLTFAKLLKNKFLLEISGSKQMASHGFSGNLGRKEKEKKKTIAWPGVKVPPETCALPGIASEKVAKILKERVQDTDDDLDDAKIPIEVNSGRLSSPLAAEAREKKGRGAGEGQVLLRHRGYILGPFEGCTGPVLCAQSQLLLSIRRGYIYIYVYTPFFSTSSQRKPPFEACPLFLSSPLSLGCTADEEEVGGGHVRLVVGRLWMRDTAYRIWIFARMWARCLGNCSGKRHLLIGMYQVRAELIGCRGEIKIVVGNCAFFPW